MKLKDKIYEGIHFETYINESNCIDGIQDAANRIETISDNFAIEFALWKETIMQDENGLYFSESRAQISRNNPVDIQELLKIYKNENHKEIY